MKVKCAFQRNYSHTRLSFGIVALFPDSIKKKDGPAWEKEQDGFMNL